MKRFRPYHFLIIPVLLLTVGCSTQKNTAISRFYHNLTSQYNVYFNARESYKEGVKKMDQSVIEDYTKLLPVFPESNPLAAQAAASEMEYAVQKCLKLIATHSISKSPNRTSNTSEKYKAFASKGEYNKWIDDTYLLMGQASYFLRNFHKARESFNNIIRNFSDQPTKNPAFLWLSRCYLENGEQEKTLEIFKLLERDGSLPDNIKKDLCLVKASYYILKNDQKEGIMQLEQALKYPLNHKDRSRYNFILAQLYLSAGNESEAVTALSQVIKSRPSYRMKFEAQISLLEHTKSSQEALDLALTKMARKSNNYPYLDRIYYAKGNIALKSGLNEEAIKNFQKSVASSLDNNSQRALSSLTVARIFFAAANYRMSACYYDSALAVIDQNHPDYEEIVSKTNGLASLVKNLDMIAREDSLQKMALMPEKNRNSIINDIIAKIAEEENLRKKEEQNQLNNQNYFRGQQYRANFNNSQQSGSQSGSQNNSMWYFYNPVTAGMGKTEFQQIWGKRKLEDNWRRKNKISLNPGENEIAGQSGENLNTESLKPKESDPKSMAYYLQDLPLTDSLMQSSHDRIKSALFAAGRTYLSVLKDEPHAISIFEELNKRYPESIYELPSWIELHRLKYQTEQYRDRITEKYPNSNYAKYLLNPNFFKELEAMKQLREGKYREATALYQKGDYAAAGKLVAEVMALQPDSILLPKAKYIELISKGKNTTQAEFSKMAEQYLADYPGSPAKPIVSRIKELIQQNSLSELEKMIAKIDSAGLNQLSGKPDKNSSAASEGKFSYDEALFHYFIISYPASAKIDVNRLIFDIANFNIDYFTSYDFDLEEIKLNDQISMVVVRSLPDKEEGLGYFANIIKQKDVFKTLQKTDYHYFIASSSNYRKLIADQDLLSYLSFFVQNYSKTSSPAK